MLVLRRKFIRGLASLKTRPFSSDESRMPNLIQMMPSYQEALKCAVDKDYANSLAKLRQTVAEVEQQVGPNSGFHLYLY